MKKDSKKEDSKKKSKKIKLSIKKIREVEETIEDRLEKKEESKKKFSEKISQEITPEDFVINSPIVEGNSTLTQIQIGGHDEPVKNLETLPRQRVEEDKDEPITYSEAKYDEGNPSNGNQDYIAQGETTRIDMESSTINFNPESGRQNTFAPIHGDLMKSNNSEGMYVPGNLQRLDQEKERNLSDIDKKGTVGFYDLSKRKKA